MEEPKFTEEQLAEIEKVVRSMSEDEIAEALLEIRRRQEMQAAIK